jgi:AraC-like DNA-binding protein
MNLTKLINQCNEYIAQSQGDRPLLPGLSVLRADRVSDIEAVVYDPVFCLILQGRKETWIGDQHVDIGPGDGLLVSHDLPVQSRITQATPQAPYLAVIVTLDMALVRGLTAQLTDAAFAQAEGRSLAAGPVDGVLLQTIGRYLDLQANPTDAQILGPGVLRELHYRLLLSPTGAMLRRLLAADGHANRVAKAILRLRRDYRASLTLPDLARTAGMSATSFHQHFKAVTGTTPLQYQKDLRLIAARSLLAERRATVTEAAFATGYESPTHFSRDYLRKFGKPPGRDARDRTTH